MCSVFNGLRLVRYLLVGALGVAQGVDNLVENRSKSSTQAGTFDLGLRPRTGSLPGDSLEMSELALSVLIVEKDLEVREFLRDLLEGKGHRVRAVSTRAAAFDALDAHGCDLMILDDPAQASAYRLVWLDQSQPDVRVELVDLRPRGLVQELEGLLEGRAA